MGIQKCNSPTSHAWWVSKGYFGALQIFPSAERQGVRISSTDLHFVDSPLCEGLLRLTGGVVQEPTDPTAFLHKIGDRGHKSDMVSQNRSG